MVLEFVPVGALVLPVHPVLARPVDENKNFIQTENVKR